MINKANFIIIVPIGGRGVELGTGVEVPVFQVEIIISIQEHDNDLVTSNTDKEIYTH